MPVGDYHLGDPQSDYKRIISDISYIRDNDDVFCVLNGDLMNSAIKSSISDTYGETLSPMEELQECMKLFEPLKDKILCLVPGNHENRHYRTNGVDMTWLMAKQLGIEDRYSPTTAVVFIRFGELSDKAFHGRKAAYTMYVAHGTGGGRKEGGKINRLADLATIVDCDIYCVGHTHLPAIFKERFARPNMANSSITYCDKLYINTSAKLNYGGYGDYGGFKPASTDTPIIILNGCKKEMRAIL